jgi:hypothetical protein
MSLTVDPTTRLVLAVIALALVWIALRPHVLPALAGASRETVRVDIERVGGRLLLSGAIPIQCADLKPR